MARDGVEPDVGIALNNATTAPIRQPAAMPIAT